MKSKGQVNGSPEGRNKTGTKTVKLAAKVGLSYCDQFAIAQFAL